jgi:hypothetical protein
LYDEGRGGDGEPHRSDGQVAVDALVDQVVEAADQVREAGDAREETEEVLRQVVGDVGELVAPGGCRGRDVDTGGDRLVQCLRRRDQVVERAGEGPVSPRPEGTPDQGGVRGDGFRCDGASLGRR